jgi:hypothetical protein
MLAAQHPRFCWMEFSADSVWNSLLVLDPTPTRLASNFDDSTPQDLLTRYSLPCELGLPLSPQYAGDEQARLTQLPEAKAPCL